MAQKPPKNLPAPRKEPAAPPSLPLREIRFREEEPFRAEDALPNIRRWNSYTPEYLEKKVNENLVSEVQERLGRASARLSDSLQMEAEEISVNDRSLTFAGAEYEISYRARDKKRGVLVLQASFRDPLFHQPGRMLLALGSLGLEPSEIAFELPFPFDPLACVKGLKKKKWTVESQLPQCVIAHHAEAGFSLRLEPAEITLFRFPSAALWADPTDPDSGNLLVQLAALLLGILG